MTNTWDGGKSDDAEIIEALVIMGGMGFDFDDLYKETLLSLWPSDNEGGPEYECRLGPNPSIPLKAQDGGWFMHHPDIMYAPHSPDLCEPRPLLIVELDGSYHDSKPGRKKTDRRDRDYRRAGIPFIAVRMSEYPDEGAWQAHLRERLKEYVALQMEGGGAGRL